MNSIEDYQALPQIKQRTADWFLQRSKILTATKVASLLHLNSYHTYHDLLQAQPQLESSTPSEITREMIQTGTISPLTWGTVLESIACQCVVQKTGHQVGELGLRVHPQIPYLGASPDGLQMLSPGQPRLVEIKCPQKRMITYRVPLEYWVQIQVGMEVWDIDRTLYGEFKFELTLDQEEWSQALAETGAKRVEAGGELGSGTGIYWLLRKSWLFEIQRDRAWFQRIKCQIAHFYSLKFLQPSIEQKQLQQQPKPSLSSLSSNNGNAKKRKREHPVQVNQQPSWANKDEEGMMTRGRAKRRRLALAQQAQQQQQASQHTRTQLLHQSIQEELDSSEEVIPSVSPKASTHPHLLPISRLSNFLRDDPILDWLECHGSDYGFERERNMFLDYYNQLNLRYKLQVFQQFRDCCLENGWQYRILNASLNNLIDLDHRYLLLKMQYDCHLIEETRQSKELGLDLIFMGQLAVQVGKYTVWDTYDLLVKQERLADFFSKLGLGPGLEPDRHSLIQALEASSLGEMDYIPIKIKYTTLEFLKNGFNLKNKHQVDLVKMGAITGGLILDRHGQLGVVPYHGKNQQVEKGIQWLKDVHFQTNWREPERALYPNMKNKYDSQWHGAKCELAKRCDELTQVAYLGVENREYLHRQGITRISELQAQPELVRDLKYGGRIATFLENKLHLPPLELNNRDSRCHNEIGTEVFLDFEYVSQLGTGQSLIFMMGILIVRPNYLDCKDGNNSSINVKSCDRYQRQFYSLVVERLDRESEEMMLSQGLEILRQLGEEEGLIPVYHWSGAEPRILKSAGYQLPENCDWCDLYDHFVKERVTLPGCYTYGLKDVASCLHELGLIQTNWLHGLDGNQAMVYAWLVHQKCELTGERFQDDPEIEKICEYNYVDVKVLEEIRRLL